MTTKTKEAPAQEMIVAQVAPHHQQVVPAGVSISADLLMRAASDPTISIEKLERLVALQERQEAKAREIAFDQALRAAQAEMPKVLRDAKNDHTKSRYATLEAVSGAIDPVIHGHGFSLSYGTYQSTMEGHYGVLCIVSNSGHSREYRADVPSDAAGAKGNSNKNLTQAFGSTMTYGRRYLKTMIFDVVLTNEDDDGHAGGGGQQQAQDRTTPREPAPEAKAPEQKKVEKKEPHEIATEGKKFVEWGAEFVAQINLADNLRALNEWRRLNANALAVIESDEKAAKLNARIVSVMQDRLAELNARAGQGQ